MKVGTPNRARYFRVWNMLWEERGWEGKGGEEERGRGGEGKWRGGQEKWNEKKHDDHNENGSDNEVKIGPLH